MVFIIDLQEVIYGLFKEPIIGPVKSKMVEIRHIGSWHQNAKTRSWRKNAIFSKTKQFRVIVSTYDL